MRTNNNRPKTNRMRYSYYLLLLFAVWLLPSSCSNEEEVASELTVLTLGVTSDPLSSLTYGIPGTGDENTVSNMRILIFNSRTLLLESNHYYGASSSNPMPSLPASLSYTLHTGPKRIIVLGNEPATLSPTLDGLSTFSDLQSLTMSDETTINTLPLRLPFSTTKELNVSPSALPSRTGIVLERGVGKIQAQIAKDGANLKTVDLQGIQLINVPSSSSLIDGYPQLSPVPANLLADPLTIADMGTAHQILNINAPYIYENFPVSAATQTILRIRLTENGTAKSADVPLVCGTNPLGQYVYGVRRNTVSNMRLTVLGEHLKVEYTLSPWNEENPWDKEPGTDDSNILFAPWDEDPGYDWELPYP